MKIGQHNNTECLLGVSASLDLYFAFVKCIISLLLRSVGHWSFLRITFGQCWIAREHVRSDSDNRGKTESMFPAIALPTQGSDPYFSSRLVPVSDIS